MASLVAATAGKAATTPTLWSRVRSVPAEYPFAFGVVLSGFKTSFSDLLVQKVIEKRENVDWKRNAAFAAFGFVYLGGVQYTLYVPVFGRLFPGAAAYAAKPLRHKLRDLRGTFSMLGQVFLDQCVHHPFMYFPAFYVTRELVMREKPDVLGVLQEYRKNMSEDLQALWKIWVPATILNFSFMPMHLRIPWVASTSLLWTCVLSAMRGGDVAHGEEMAGGALTGATMTFVEEGLGQLFTSPLELDRNKSHVMITASGKDRAGWVALLTRTVADAGGNVTHSRMVRLGNEFIVHMHASVEPQHYLSLVKAVKNNSELKPLNVSCQAISPRHTGTFDRAVMGFRLRCVGADKPGMLASIAESLAAKGLSIENVSTELRRGKDDRRDFVVDADCVSTEYIDQQHLQDMTSELSSLKNALGLDIMDVRVQRLASVSRHQSAAKVQ